MTMRTIPIVTETIDQETGRVSDRQVGSAQIMPCHPDACQVCGRRPAHDPEQPHDAQSLYYQYAFYGEHGRWPTWKDAVAHCATEVRERWERELRARGKWSEPTEPATVS